MMKNLPPTGPAHVYYERCIYCAKCGYAVENEMAKLDSRVFHVECFTCDKCQGSLVGKQVHIEDGKKYDEECYVQVATKRCDICDQPILGDNEKYVKAKGKMYHSNCYVCYICSTSLRKNRHTVQGNKRICQACVTANRKTPSTSGGAFGGAFNTGENPNDEISEEL